MNSRMQQTLCSCLPRGTLSLSRTYGNNYLFLAGASGNGGGIIGIPSGGGSKRVGASAGADNGSSIYRIEGEMRQRAGGKTPPLAVLQQ